MAGQAPKMRISQTPKAQVTRKTKLDCLRPEWQKKDRVTVKPPLPATSISTMATFLADSPCIDSCLNLSTTATSLQWPFSSVPKVAIQVQLYYSRCVTTNSLFPFFKRPQFLILSVVGDVCSYYLLSYTHP